MKHETNNEMDLLLRRLGRRDSDPVAPSDERHLDADELSSYAENALPATTRARYTEHLAECASCRKLVTELSLSYGATAAAPVETVVAAGGLKKFLASLFSPMVLRYAVPALGVLVVMIVGFVVLRQQRQESFVARVYDEQKPASVATKQDASAPAASPSQEIDKLQKEANNQPQRDERAGKASESKPQRGAADERDAAASAPPAKDEKSAAEPQPVVASTPAPTAAPKVAAVSEEEAKKMEAQRRKQPATETVSVTADGEVAKAQANEIRIAPQADKKSRRAEPETADRSDKDKQKPSDTTGFIGGIASVNRSRRGDSAGDAETRSIAGRRFRKERGIWTDTAYDSSTAIVSVARGSEQFRALVADEPEIETIAKQLDGEVIVVWKGRAYRIR